MQVLCWRGSRAKTGQSFSSGCLMLQCAWSGLAVSCSCVCLQICSWLICRSVTFANSFKHLLRLLTAANACAVLARPTHAKSIRSFSPDWFACISTHDMLARPLPIQLAHPPCRLCCPCCKPLLDPLANRCKSPCCVG